MPPGKELEQWLQIFEKVWKESTKRTTDELKELREAVEQLQIKVAKLEVKAGVWGLLGGAIAVIIGLAIWFLRSQNG